MGTGILAITAARRGWRAFGVDISRRALRVAAANAGLNGVSVTLAVDDLARGLQGGGVQLCMANLPFEPTPEGCTNYLHSDGGFYGDKLTAPFLELVSSILAPEGVAMVPSFSLLSEPTGRTRLETQLAGSGLGDLRRAVVRLSRSQDLRGLYARYGGGVWKSSCSRLRKEGYSKFCIEVGVLRKVSVGAANVGTYEVPVAGREWIMPLGFAGVGRPRQGAT